MDVVYPVRPGDDNEELRYSLRSLTNLKHGQVWIAGHRPDWCTARHIPTDQYRDKPANALANLLAVIASDELDETVLWLNDDMFAMEPAGEMPTLHGGPLADRLTLYRDRHPNSTYTAAMADTLALLKRWGIDEPLTYSIHYPLAINRLELADVIDRWLIDTRTMSADRALRMHWRTLYGNIAHLGGDQVEDCKVYDLKPGEWTSWPWLSTDDRTFTDGAVGEHIRARFPAAGRYERSAAEERRAS